MTVTPRSRRAHNDAKAMTAPLADWLVSVTGRMIVLLMIVSTQLLRVQAFSINSAPVVWISASFENARRSPRSAGLLRLASTHLSARSTKVKAETEETVATIQILMSDTGGGHRASANALRDAFDVLYPGRIHCDIVDIYTDYGPFWPFNDYVRLYKIMAEYSFLWDVFYQLGATPIGLWFNEWMLDVFCFESFRDCLARPSGDTVARADMVVSVHPLCQDLPLKILSSLDSNGQSRDPNARTTPFATVVTDLAGAHPTWFNPNVDKCFVPTDVLYQCAIDRGLNKSQIVLDGLPIRKGFWGPDDGRRDANELANEKNRMRKKLGIETDLPTVLVVGGGDGMGGIVDIAMSLGKKLGNSINCLSYQMVVVCGSNEKAKTKLSREDWGDGVHVTPTGFVDNMDEWMKAADILVTKAGPGTIAEASICGLPCMMFNFLPGQEAGNVPYVEQSGFGRYSSDPTVIADTVESWLESPDKLASMSEAALKAARPKSTLDIANDLAGMLFARKDAMQLQELSARSL